MRNSAELSTHDIEPSHNIPKKPYSDALAPLDLTHAIGYILIRIMNTSHPIIEALAFFGELIYKGVVYIYELACDMVSFSNSNKPKSFSGDMIWALICLAFSLYCMYQWYSIGIFTMDGFLWGIYSIPSTIWGHVAMWKEDGKDDNG